MKRRREFEIFSMSFLDAICCGFGAMILLFLVIRTSEPGRLEQAERDLDGLIAQYEQELNEIVGETERVRRQELSTTRDVQVDRTRVETLQAQLERIRAQVLAVEDPTLEVEQNRLASAK
jgi:chromosome segregation ATPase